MNTRHYQMQNGIEIYITSYTNIMKYFSTVAILIIILVFNLVVISRFDYSLQSLILTLICIVVDLMLVWRMIVLLNRQRTTDSDSK